ncbi:hypothetical protein JCM6882_004049 [Rhodosporidiobolus microsporus]
MSSTADRWILDRFNIFSSVKRHPSGQEQSIRIPLELILRILDLVSQDCIDDIDRQRFHSNLACVNRTFSLLYGRREWRIVGARAGAQVDDLIQRLKSDRTGQENRWIEGIEHEDLTRDFKGRQWADFWPELRRRCKHLTWVHLGRPSIPPSPTRSVCGHTLFSMSGITTLRLVHLEVAHSLTPSTFFGKKPHLVPLIPLKLRHLVLDRVQISHILYEKELDSLFSPPEDCHLVSLFVANLKLTTFVPKPDTLTAPLRAFVRRNARTLQALHYSRLCATRVEPETPFFTPGFLLPNLRLLSLSLLHFNKDVLSAVPNLDHLTLTLCDLVGQHDDNDRARVIKEGGALLIETLSDRSALKFLKLLVLPVREAAPRVNGSEWEGEEAAAQAAGVKVERWDMGERGGVEKRFRSSVRDALLERM